MVLQSKINVGLFERSLFEKIRGSGSRIRYGELGCKSQLRAPMHRDEALERVAADKRPRTHEVARPSRRGRPCTHTHGCFRPIRSSWSLCRQEATPRRGRRRS